MRVRLRGFGEYELRPRPVTGEAIEGKLVKLDARTIDRLLRVALSELSPHRLRGLLERSSERGRAHDQVAMLGELRRMIDRGELVFVALPQRSRSARPIEIEEPELHEPTGPEEIVEQVDWIEILVVDEDDQPVRSVAYELELPDGSIRRGQTNADGIARCDRIPSGTCKLTLVELDTQAWSYPA
jgi:hypothetical protein